MGPPKLLSSFISPITLWFMVLITIVTGVSKPTWLFRGPHIVGVNSRVTWTTSQQGPRARGRSLRRRHSALGGAAEQRHGAATARRSISLDARNWIFFGGKSTGTGYL